MKLASTVMLLVSCTRCMIGADPNVRLFAYWEPMIPAARISPDGSQFVYSNDSAATTAVYHVFVQNISNHEIVVPTFLRGGYPVVTMGGAHRLNTLIYGFHSAAPFGDTQIGRLAESECAFHPVSLRPNEFAEMSLWSVILKSTEEAPKYFVRLEVDDDLAKRYGWWSGVVETFSSRYSEDGSFGRVGNLKIPKAEAPR